MVKNYTYGYNKFFKAWNESTVKSTIWNRKLSQLAYGMVQKFVYLLGQVFLRLHYSILCILWKAQQVNCSDLHIHFIIPPINSLGSCLLLLAKQRYNIHFRLSSPGRSISTPHALAIIPKPTSDLRERLKVRVQNVTCDI